MTEVERAEALEAIAAEIATCTRCRLHEGRTRAVPGEGNPDTEVVLIGEGPGFNEDRQGRPFVGRAGAILVDLLGQIGWRREDVFITNIVKCRPPGNRDPEPDEIAACAPYLRRQLAALDPALVVTLGRHSMARFMPGTRIGQAHGTWAPADPATGAGNALVYAMYHPAAADRSTEVLRQSRIDVQGVPAALLEARRRRDAVARSPEPAPPVALTLDETGGHDADAPGEVAVAGEAQPAPAAASHGTTDDGAPPPPEPGPALPASRPSPELEPARPADQLTLF